MKNVLLLNGYIHHPKPQGYCEMKLGQKYPITFDFKRIFKWLIFYTDLHPYLHINTMFKFLQLHCGSRLNLLHQLILHLSFKLNTGGSNFV